MCAFGRLTGGTAAVDDAGMRMTDSLGVVLVLVLAAGCSSGSETSASGFGTAPMTASGPMTGETSETGGAGSTGVPTGTSEAPTGTAETGGGSTSGAGSSSGDASTGSGDSSGEAGSTGMVGSTGEGSTGAAAVCGDGVKDVGEACDDGNPDNGDACLDTCVAAKCGDKFVQVGVEVCDGMNLPNASCGVDCKSTCNKDFGDCNMMAGDGCELSLLADNNNCGKCANKCVGNAKCVNSTCVGGMAMDHGPEHIFVGLQSNHYITQGGCSVNGNQDTDADYFCKHFYGVNCMVKPGYFIAQTPFPNYPKMHKQGGCTGQGFDIPNTTCDNGACKIGDWAENTTGLTNLVCSCT